MAEKKKYGSVTDELLNGTFDATPTNLNKPKSDISQSTITDEILSGSDFNRSLSLPNVQKVGSRAAGAGTAFMAGVPTNQKDAIKVFAKARGIPESKYAVVDGQIAYQAEDGKWYAEVAGRASPVTTAAYYTPDIAEAIPSVATGIFTAPNPAVAIPATGAVGYAANAVRQRIGNAIVGGGAEPVNQGQAITSGLLNAAAETLPFAYKGLKEWNLARDINRINPLEVSMRTRQANKFGIPLTPAEITGLSSLKAEQKALTNMPTSSDIMNDFYNKRFRENIQPAIDNFLGRVSSVTEPVEAGAKATKALQEQRNNIIQTRKLAADPLYKAAEIDAPPIDVTPIIKQIDDMMVNAGVSEKAALDRVKRNLYQDAEQTKLKTNVQGLHRAKIDIRSLIKEGKANNSLDSIVQGDIKQILGSLDNVMSDTVPAYKEANMKFAELSKPLEEFDARKTGVVLSRLTPDNVHTFANKLFTNADPSSIIYAKKQILATEGGKETWDGVTRAWLQDNWERAIKPKVSSQGLPVDAGASWSKMLLGDQKQNKGLRVALDPKQYQSLVELGQVLDSAGSVKKLMSDTAWNTEVTNQMKSKMGSKLAQVFNVNIAQPLKPVADFLDKRTIEQSMEKMAQIITSPDGMARIKELKKMSPTSVKFGAGLSQLLADYALIGQDKMPEGYIEQ
jgi:hypothetical protein